MYQIGNKSVLNFRGDTVGDTVVFASACNEIWDRDSIKDAILKGNYEAYYSLKNKECEGVCI